MNRPSMIAALGDILDHLRNPKQASGDLFANPHDKIMGMVKPMQDWPLSTKLWMERKFLGTWVSGHPMELVRGKYEHRIKHKLVDMQSLLEIASSNETFNFAFIVIELRVIRGKIVVLDVEDETGRAELNAFASDCDALWHLMRKDNILIAQCHPRHNGKFSAMHMARLHKLGELTEPDDATLFIPAKN